MPCWRGHAARCFLFCSLLLVPASATKREFLCRIPTARECYPWVGPRLPSSPTTVLYCTRRRRCGAALAQGAMYLRYFAGAMYARPLSPNVRRRTSPAVASNRGATFRVPMNLQQMPRDCLCKDKHAFHANFPHSCIANTTIDRNWPPVEPLR